jgi:DNA-binding response OmpR family regulator
MRILLVEDDELLAEVIAEFLSDHFYIVDVIADGETAWQQIKMLDYDLVLLDIMLPELDGIALCKRLRSQRYSVPILMSTARDTSTDKVLGLDAGADDYMVKPLDFPELLARIRALLRRGNYVDCSILEWDGLQLDLATYEVSYNHQSLRLTPKELRFLELFLRNGQRVISRSVIIEQIWSLAEPPEENTIKTHIKSLRKKLKLVGAPDDLIETVHGIGYRLNPLLGK